MSEDPKSSDSVPMLSRFSGAAGRELLLEVLSDTSLLRGVTDLQNFVEVSELIEVSSGSEITTQGSPDNQLFVIVSGSFNILVNGRQVATRRVGAHVGEMALVDPTARRSASAVAAEHSLVLKCSEEHFSKFANDHPKLWRRLAVELSRRLTERNRLIKAPRTQPALFVACSTEAIGIAREIQAAFDYDPIVVEIWTDGVFNPSKTPIEDLTELIARIDFAVILLTPDDNVESRGVEAFGPRDNVVLELGLAIGAIGRSRTLLLTPRGFAFKLPSDLLGVKPIDYPEGELSTIKSRLGPACNEVRKLINRLGPI
jgi:CRP/FNR family cyclic AMP-dependent transcriptional regulator